MIVLNKISIDAYGCIGIRPERLYEESTLILEDSGFNQERAL
jgi:hypothetical protein